MSYLLAIVIILAVTVLPHAAYREGVKVGRTEVALDQANADIERYNTLHDFVKSQRDKEERLIEQMQALDKGLSKKVNHAVSAISRPAHIDCSPSAAVVGVLNGAKFATPVRNAASRTYEKDTNAQPPSGQ